MSRASVRLRFARMLKAVTSGRLEGALDDEKSEAASPPVPVPGLLPSLAAIAGAIVDIPGYLSVHAMAAFKAPPSLLNARWCRTRTESGQALALPSLALADSGSIFYQMEASSSDIAYANLMLTPPPASYIEYAHSGSWTAPLRLTQPRLARGLCSLDLLGPGQ